jgi:hypothetical protein
LFDYFKGLHKETLPLTPEEVENVFMDEDYRKDVLRDSKEFSDANKSKPPSVNKR